MKVRYTKSFEKAVDKLSGKQLKSVLDVIKEVKEAQRIEDIPVPCFKRPGIHEENREGTEKD